MANKVEVDETHLRHCLLFLLRQRRNVTEATRNIYKTYGAVVEVNECQCWYGKFWSGDFCSDSLLSASADLPQFLSRLCGPCWTRQRPNQFRISVLHHNKGSSFRCYFTVEDLHMSLKASRRPLSMIFIVCFFPDDSPTAYHWTSGD